VKDVYKDKSLASRTEARMWFTRVALAIAVILVLSSSVGIALGLAALDFGYAGTALEWFLIGIGLGVAAEISLSVAR
jgi:hypothetical protein